MSAAFRQDLIDLVRKHDKDTEAGVSAKTLGHYLGDMCLIFIHTLKETE